MKHVVEKEHRAFAKRRRQQRTRGEEMIWTAVRASRLGHKFKREVPFGSYVADFSCVRARLVVEVDGRTHEENGRAARDAQRDQWFAEQGIHVLRLKDDFVIGSPDLAVQRIVAALDRPSPDPALQGHPLPEREREGAR